ncbi:MAG: cysteine--tRNA ligase [Candidatus Limnocylindrus sp.]
MTNVETALQLRDTLSGATRPFVPLNPDQIGIYSCGPTIYGPAHIGNFRSFLFADLLVRWLRASGHTVRWVVNLTDIDDKIIRAAANEGVEIRALTDRWERVFRSDMQALRMTEPDVMPRATEHIPEQIAIVERLLEKGHAYKTEDGSIFFRIASWPSYGTLARLDPEAMRVGERVEADEYSKDDVRDFVLWKAAKRGEPSWEASIGAGRPGWHLECSAMSMRYLGERFDLHTGGVDLIFPHHEDEIAQSEAATGKRFVGTWLHCAHLHVSGDKMSKSLGNIARVSDLLAEGVEPRALRLALISAHYRTSLNYTSDSLPAAVAAIERLDAFDAALSARASRAADAPEELSPDVAELATSTRTRFAAAMNDDLALPEALAALFDFIREGNRHLDAACSAASAVALRETLQSLDKTLALLPAAVMLPAGAEELLAARVAARAARDFATSDRLRDELAALGVLVEDSRDGQRWRISGTN